MIPWNTDQGVGKWGGEKKEADKLCVIKQVTTVGHAGDPRGDCVEHSPQITTYGARRLGHHLPSPVVISWGIPGKKWSGVKSPALLACPAHEHKGARNVRMVSAERIWVGMWVSACAGIWKHKAECSNPRPCGHSVKWGSGGLKTSLQCNRINTRMEVSILGCGSLEVELLTSLRFRDGILEKSRD